MSCSRLAAAALVATVCFAGTAHAQVYAGGSLGLSRLTQDCTGAPFCDRSGSAYKLFAGYMHTPYLGVEAVFYDQGKARITTTSLALGEERREFSGNGAGVFLVAVAPFDAASMHVKAGAFSSRTRLDTSSSVLGTARESQRSAAFAWGFGGAYALTLKASARLEFERVDVRYRSARTHLDLFTASVLYRF
jgi:OOP family OmpA-OmpF porin